jgi:hypothetical protein
MGATDLTSGSSTSRSRGTISSPDEAKRADQGLLPALPALIAVAVMILWAEHDGGYDADTWYWGALFLLSVLVVTVGTFGTGWKRWHRGLRLGLIAFGLYVAWSYLSITWAGYQGDALTGSNRALLYLIVFALFAVTPWTASRARAVMLVYAIGVGLVGVSILATMASGHHSGSLFNEGRLISPTGYFNTSAALFTSAAFVAITLAVRKQLPAPVRGILVAIACEGIVLALLAESRGWLFTLPLVLIAAIAVAPSRLRTVVASILPAVGALAALAPLLDVFRASSGVDPTQSALVAAARHAGRVSLAICAVLLVLGTLLAAVDARITGPMLTRRGRGLLGGIAAGLALTAAVAGGVVATHGHPFAFVKHQWDGFTHPEGSSSSSHFGVVGSGRYDAWRVSLDALKAHPIGGLGQDNYADYYIRHRRTSEELQWTHSLELRLLAHTGLVGFILFATFLLAALSAALRNRRRGGAVGAMAGIALLPLVVWLIHGSVDWFWEMPALSGPALGFLAMSGALGGPPGAAGHRAATVPGSGGGTVPGPAEPEAEAKAEQRTPRRRRPIPRAVCVAIGTLALIAAVVALGFPYLSVREVSTANDLRAKNPAAALSDLRVAAGLNPLSADPGRLGGTIALQTGRFTEAKMRFNQAISREPGGWFAWLGAGLAASEQGDTRTAQRYFSVAASINSQQPAVAEALKRVFSRDPLTTAEAFNLLVVVR